MGARQSKRSVDITTTPKKEGIPSEGAVVGDAATPGDGKLERIEESDAKPTTNGIAYRTDVTEDKDKDKDEATEKDKEKESEEVKSEDTKQESSGEPSAEGAEVTTPTEGNPASPNTVASPDSKEPKKKDKMRKKWSLRSISFSKKDKSKPTREETPKNGDVTKEEPLAEGGEDGDHAANSSAEDKSAVSSPSENETSSTPLSSAVEAKEESGAASATTTTTTTTTTVPAAAVATTPETAAPTATTTPPATSPVAEEKKEEPTPSAPTPVPLEDKKEEVEKVEAEKKVVEVSPDGGRSLADSIKVSVFRVQPVDTPSIIERKTSEDLPSQLPSSPPPTPIEPSPLQQAQQAAATAVTVTALAKALELPVEPVVDKDVTTEVNSTLPTILHQDPLEDAPESSLSTRVSNNDPLERSSPILSNLESTTIENIIIPVDVDSALLLTKDEPVGIVNKTDETVPVLTEPDKTNFRSKLETVKTDSKMLGNEATNVEDIPKSSKSISDNIIEDIETTEELETDVTKVEETEENVEIVSKAEKVPDEQADKFIEVVKEVIIETPSCEDIIKEDHEIIILEDVEDPNPSSVVSNPEGACNEHIIVEAKPAVVIPCEEVEEEEEVDIIEEVAEVKTTDSVEVIPKEEKIEAEPILSDTSLPVKDVLVEEMNELDVSSSIDVSIELIDHFITDTITVVEKLAGGGKDIIEIAEVESSVSLPISETKESLDELIPEQAHLLPPPPPPPSSLTSTTIIEVASNEQLSKVQANESLEDLTNANELSSSSQKDTIVTTNVPTERQSPSHTTTVTRIATPPPSSSPPPPLPPSSIKEEDTSCRLQSESSEFPLPPPNEITTKSPPSSPRCNVSQTSSNLTEIDQTSIASPNPSNRSSTSIVSSTTTATNDCSQTLLHDDQTDRDLKTESVSQSLNSYNDSEVELKERLAQSLAETENQKETLSCRSLNDDVSTAFQENHQSTPEVENPVVEKTTVTNEIGTTESNVEEAPKVAPPAIPIEVPASPPSAPAITEDVASVTKAIEEIDISDKAVAAAVNEAIECNTNEIIADAHHQNNMNE